VFLQDFATPKKRSDIFISEATFAEQTVSQTCSSVLRLALQSPQTYTQDIATAIRLYDLVYQVRRTHSFQAVNHRSQLQGDVTARRLWIVISSNAATAGHLIDSDIAEACQRIEQYRSFA
jgi:hypothetical protein